MFPSKRPFSSLFFFILLESHSVCVCVCVSVHTYKSSPFPLEISLCMSLVGKISKCHDMLLLPSHLSLLFLSHRLICSLLYP